MKFSIEEKKIKSTPLISAIVTFEDDIPACYLNAFRRLQLDNEVPVKYLHVDIEDIKTSDPYCVPIFVQRELKACPILQSIPLKSTFSLKVSNKNSSYPMSVKADSIQGLCPKYASELYKLCDISPRYDLELNKIRVETSRLDARCSTSCKWFAGKNYKTQKCELRFTTMGTDTPKNIIKDTTQLMINRLAMARERVNTIIPNGFQYTRDGYLWSLPAETDTIGQPIVRAVSDLYKMQVDITTMHDKNSYTQGFVINVDTGLDPKKIINAAIDRVTNFYMELIESI